MGWDRSCASMPTKVSDTIYIHTNRRQYQIRIWHLILIKSLWFSFWFVNNKFSYVSTFRILVFTKRYRPKRYRLGALLRDFVRIHFHFAFISKWNLVCFAYTKWQTTTNELEVPKNRHIGQISTWWHGHWQGRRVFFFFFLLSFVFPVQNLQSSMYVYVYYKRNSISYHLFDATQESLLTNHGWPINWNVVALWLCECDQSKYLWTKWTGFWCGRNWMAWVGHDRRLKQRNYYLFRTVTKVFVISQGLFVSHWIPFLHFSKFTMTEFTHCGLTRSRAHA